MKSLNRICLTLAVMTTLYQACNSYRYLPASSNSYQGGIPVSSSRMYFKHPTFQYFHEQTYPGFQPVNPGFQPVNPGFQPVTYHQPTTNYYNPYYIPTEIPFYHRKHKPTFTPATEVDHHLPAASSGQYKNYLDDLKEIFKEERDFIYKSETERLQKEYGLLLFVNDEDYHRRASNKTENINKNENQNNNFIPRPSTTSTRVSSYHNGGGFRYEINL